jgi:hypothetical protein
MAVEHAHPARTAASLDQNEPLLRGLPNEPFALAIGLANDRSNSRLKAVGRLAVSAMVYSNIIGPERASELMTLYGSMGPRISAASVSIARLPESAGGSLAFTKVIRAHGEGHAILEEVDNVLASVRGLFLDPKVNALMERLVHRRGVETCGEISVDHLTVEFTGEVPEAYAPLQKVLGAEGLLVRAAVVDNSVVMTLGGGLPRFAEVVDAVRAGRAPLAGDPYVTESAAHLPRERSLEAYVSIRQVERLMHGLTQGDGEQPSERTSAAPTAPIALTVRTVTPDTLQMEAFIPIEALEQMAWPWKGGP